MEAGAGSSAASLRFAVYALAGAGALAAISLLAPFEPVFDAWAWSIWGREIVGGDLDTSAGASWKPGPVLVTTPAALLGDAGAPALWLAVARTGWLLAVALAARLAWRLARGCGVGERAALAAAGVAAVSLVLLHDGFTPWIRQFAGGLAEPLLVALVLGAIEAHLSEARRAALGLLVAAALLRPEVWPFLAAYGWWLWRADGGASLRPWLLGAAVAVPALWFVPDLIGSGSATSGAERAAADREGPLTNGLEALWRALGLAPAALLAALALLLAGRWRAGLDGPGDRTIARLAALAGAWAAVVFAMALAGFAGLPRFSAPAGALGCVLGAVALVLIAARAREGGRWVAVGVAALAVALAVQWGWRTVALVDGVGEATTIAGEVKELRVLIERVGPERFARCGALTTTDLDSEAALAWELERTVAAVWLRRESVGTTGIALIGPQADPAARAAVAESGATEIAAAGAWRAYEISCSAGARASAATGRGGGSR